MDSVFAEIQAAFARHPQLDWLAIFSIAAGCTMVTRSVVRFLLKKIESQFSQSQTDPAKHFSIKNTIYQLSQSTHWWVVFMWLLHQLAKNTYQSESVIKLTFPLAVIALGFQVSIWGLRYIEIWQNRYIKKRISQDASARTVSELISTVLKSTFVIFVALACLSNLGVNIGTFVAGLGIGGIAIALAAQNILGDIFASLSIIFDKPFIIGDYITVGQEQGTVEHVGVKTTRVRSISGEELIFSNKDLLESRIRNFRRMWKRRVVISFALPLNLEVQKLKEVPHWIRDLLESQSQITIDRCHLASFANAYANYELVYWVNSPNFNLHMDLQQEFLLKFLEKLNSHGISIAIPSQELIFNESTLKAINFKSESQEITT